VRVGAQIPDFSFVDFEGKVRKLSDFKSKYVMLEFWGTWCVSCVAAIPYLKEAYSRYHSRGFEILGMDMEMPENNDQSEALQKAKTLIMEKGVAWPQATTESIKTLVEKRLRIVSYPTSILMDQERRVVSSGFVDFEELTDTLEKLLPASS